MLARENQSVDFERCENFLVHQLELIHSVGSEWHKILLFGQIEPVEFVGL